MNKYKNRNGKGNLLVDKELSLYSEIVIYIASGYISPVFPQTDNSNPSDLVCLNPIKEISIQRSFIGLTQWNEVLSPVVQRVSTLIGKLPTSSSPIDFKNIRLGYSSYNESSLGSLYVPSDDSLLDLVKKMIIQQAKLMGYGT